MAKTLGYIIALIGILALALSFQPIKTLLKISLPAQITDLYLMIGGIIIIIIGIIIVMRSPRKVSAEVPIYQGNKIVGYRR